MSETINFTIREFQEADLDRLLHLINETINVSYSAVYPERAVTFFKSFHSREKLLERSRTGTVLVVEEDGKLSATGSLVNGEIFAVFVKPGLQGGGHGKTIMGALEEKAAAEGVIKSVLSVSLPAKKFYEKLGYEIIEERSRDVGEGQRLEFWKAKKLLAKPPVRF